MNSRLCALFALFCLLLAGCAAKLPAEEPPAAARENPEQPPALSRAEASAASIPAPALPAALKAAALADPSPALSVPSGQALPYTLVCEAPGAPELAEAFTKNSLLQRLTDTPPAGFTGLEQRLAASLAEGRDMLRGSGHYAGTVSGEIEPPAAPAPREDEKPPDDHASAGAPDQDAAYRAVVRVRFDPGPLYTLAESRVMLPDGTAPSGPGLPSTLADVGLPPGSPAVADAVLSAVDKARDAFWEHGYPFAKTEGVRYVLNHETRRLEAEVRINPGAFTRMGNIRPQGDISVVFAYLDALRGWMPGEAWRRQAVEDFRDKLQQSGLFRSVEIAPADEADADGRRDVLVAAESAPERTISGALKYDSDFGIGAQAEWEHRNLTGRGDGLRLALSGWQDMQEFTAGYRLPYFLHPDQSFISQAGVLHEDTDAYELRSGAAAAGLERHFTPQWSGSVRMSAEGGDIKDPHSARQEYAMFGLPLGLTYDNTGSRLDAVRGVRALISASPYTGTYFDMFTALRARMDAHAFLPLIGQDRLVLALRGTYGSVWGADARDLPPSLRFYSGGGGSVRGYAYQSLGPRDRDGNPLGGTSLAELSGEARWKITPEWGITAFVDGGTAYENDIWNSGGEMHWGAGLGLRFHTAIGPLRFDAATPVNPRSDDAPLQFYISIGQSF